MSSLSDSDVCAFIGFVREAKNIDLTGYRVSFISRRLSARLLAYKMKGLEEYKSFLGDNPKEWNQFFENLCINVSEFFRDPDVFRSFTDNCMDGLIDYARDSGRKTINIWSCGCSCGEESYSLAILFKCFFFERNVGDITFKIKATDIDTDALMKARQGVYFASSLINVPDNMRAKYFTFIPKAASHLDEDAWQVNDDIRRLVEFQRHNLMSDDMYGDMDAVFMRNVRIYFNKRHAKDILIRAHSALRDRGFFVLGKIESIGVTLRHMFKTIDAVNRIYGKI